MSAGKLKDETRFRFTNVPEFECLSSSGKKEDRIKVIFFDEAMNEKYREKLTFFESLYKKCS